MQPVLSAVMPTFGREEIFKISIVHLVEACVDLPVEIIVVNDDQTQAINLPEKAEGRVRVVDNDTGSGVASARNLGVREAKAPHFVVLDNDMIVSRKHIESLLAFIEERPDSVHNFDWVYPPELEDRLARLPFGRYLQRFGFTTRKGWGDGPGRRENAISLFETPASNIMTMPKPVFERVGGYDANFPHAGFEDYDIQQKLVRDGVPCYLDTRHPVYHNESDRLDVGAFIDRKRRGGLTRKVAVARGYEEARLNVPVHKRAVYYLSSRAYNVGIGVARKWPNVPALDPLFFRLVNFLLGTAIYAGYYLDGRQVGE